MAPARELFETYKEAFGETHDVTIKLLVTKKTCDKAQNDHSDNKQQTCFHGRKGTQHCCGKTVSETGVHSCKRGRTWEQLAEEAGCVNNTRALCHFSVFMAIESDTSLHVGTDISDAKINFQKTLNGREIPIAVLDHLLLSGSTPHAGTSFSTNVEDGFHLRIFIQVTPRGTVTNNVGFTANIGDPQHKLTKIA
jgi:hypothetical protein